MMTISLGLRNFSSATLVPLKMSNINQAHNATWVKQNIMHYKYKTIVNPTSPSPPVPAKWPFKKSKFIISWDLPEGRHHQNENNCLKTNVEGEPADPSPDCCTQLLGGENLLRAKLPPHPSPITETIIQK